MNVGVLLILGGFVQFWKKGKNRGGLVGVI